MMINMFKKLVAVFFILLLPSIAFAQAAGRSIAVIKADLKKVNDNAGQAKLLLELALAYVKKPGEEKSDLDSALLLVKQAETVNSKLLRKKDIAAKIYFTYSQVYREKGEEAIGITFINRSLNLYKTRSLFAETAEAYVETANYIKITTFDDINKKKPLYDTALSFFRKAGNRQRQADVLKDLGDFNQLLRNNGLAVNQLKEALSIYLSINYKPLQGIYDLLGIVATGMGDYPGAVNYGLLAVKTAEEQNDTSMQLCTIYSRLAVAYNNWSKVREGDKYQKMALEVALKYHDNDAIQITLLNLCYSLVRQHQYQASLKLLHATEKDIKLYTTADSMFLFAAYFFTFNEAKNYTEAEKYNRIIKDAIKRLDRNEAILASLYGTLINYSINTHQYISAKNYAEDFEAYATRSNSKRLVAVSAFLNSRTDSARGNYKQALHIYQLYKRISDSMNDETRAFQVAQMQVAFQTEKKDDSLRLSQKDIQLLQKQNQLQQSDLTQVSFTRNIIIGAALLTVILLFSGYLFKQKSNRKLQVQQKEINLKNEILEQTVSEKNNLLEEKEWLVKEIHHRVKNNLQIVISLLSTQSKYLDNEEAIAAISESRHRMQAMSLIHQKLYQSENTTSVNMQSYITELADYLKTSFNSGKEINFLVNVEAIELDLAQAIPLGLILNEIITNAIKYAFAEREAGSIGLKMLKTDAQNIMLEVRDNGIGLPDNFDWRNSASMGIRLVKGLAKQINATLNIKNEQGVCVQIGFSDIKVKGVSLA